MPETESENGEGDQLALLEAAVDRAESPPTLSPLPERERRSPVPDPFRGDGDDNGTSQTTQPIKGKRI